MIGTGRDSIRSLIALFALGLAAVAPVAAAQEVEDPAPRRRQTRKPP